MEFTVKKISVSYAKSGVILFVVTYTYFPTTKHIKRTFRYLFSLSSTKIYVVNSRTKDVPNVLSFTL